jgi:hypothetical protein
MSKETSERRDRAEASTVTQGEARATVASLRGSTFRLGRYALLALAAALISLWLLNLYAVDALAQQGGGGGGGGDAIESTLTNVRDYIAGLLLVLGGIGFVVSLGLKAASPVNENAQYLAHMGLKSSAIAVLAGAIVAPIMDIIQGLATGG